jgi:hypothetical protein
MYILDYSIEWYDNIWLNGREMVGIGPGLF